jgi:hypothetical protein
MLGVLHVRIRLLLNCREYTAEHFNLQTFVDERYARVLCLNSIAYRIPQQITRYCAVVKLHEFFGFWAFFCCQHAQPGIASGYHSRRISHMNYPRISAFLALAAACGFAHAEIPIEACAIASYQAALYRAVPPKLDARAVWLNRQFIKWPGADATARFRLLRTGRFRPDENRQQS